MCEKSGRLLGPGCTLQLANELIYAFLSLLLIRSSFGYFMIVSNSPLTAWSCY